MMNPYKQLTPPVFWCDNCKVIVYLQVAEATPHKTYEDSRPRIEPLIPTATGKPSPEMKS
jgi:hypothetical protein